MFTEDLTPFFADFGVPVTIAGGQPVQGIFDDNSVVLSGGVYGQSSTQPTLTVPAASITGDPIGQTVVVAGTSYLIDAPDLEVRAGNGVSRFLLVRA